MRRSALIIACVLAWAIAGPSPPAHALPPDAPADGFHGEPSVFWKSGNHRIDLGAETRFRTEWWDSRSTDTSTFYALRTRLRARYSYKDEYILFGEFQDAHLWSLEPDSSGAAAVYRAFSPFPMPAMHRSGSTTAGSPLVTDGSSWRAALQRVLFIPDPQLQSI